MDLDVTQLLQASRIRLLVLVIILLLEIVSAATVHDESPGEVHGSRGEGTATGAEQDSRHDAEDVSGAVLDVLGEGYPRMILSDPRLLGGGGKGREESVAAIDEEGDGVETADREDGDESG